MAEIDGKSLKELDTNASSDVGLLSGGHRELDGALPPEGNYHTTTMAPRVISELEGRPRAEATFPVNDHGLTPTQGLQSVDWALGVPIVDSTTPKSKCSSSR